VRARVLEYVLLEYIGHYGCRKKSERQDLMRPIVGTPIVSEFRVPGLSAGIKQIGDGDAGNGSAYVT